MQLFHNRTGFIAWPMFHAWEWYQYHTTMHWGDNGFPLMKATNCLKNPLVFSMRTKLIKNCGILDKILVPLQRSRLKLVTTHHFAISFSVTSNFSLMQLFLDRTRNAAWSVLFYSDVTHLMTSNCQNHPTNLSFYFRWVKFWKCLQDPCSRLAPISIVDLCHSSSFFGHITSPGGSSELSLVTPGTWVAGSGNGEICCW